MKVPINVRVDGELLAEVDGAADALQVKRTAAIEDGLRLWLKGARKLLKAASGSLDALEAEPTNHADIGAVEREIVR